MGENKETSENKSGTDSTETEKSEKQISKIDLNHRWINQEQVHKLKQNGQRSKIVKIEHFTII